MLLTNRQTTSTPDADARPFDHKLSAKIDRVIQGLDESPTGVRWLWLKAQKRYYERNVPAVLKATDTVHRAMQPCCNCQDAMGFSSIDGLALCEPCREVL